jgi:hypothetical protein
MGGVLGFELKALCLLEFELRGMTQVLYHPWLVF